MVTTSLSKQDKAKEIVQRALTVKSFWRERDAEWSEVRAMIAKAYLKPKPGYEQFLSNEPKALTDLAVAIISGKPPRWRMPITSQDPEERAKTSKTERLVDGIMREVARTHRRRLHGDWLRELTWYICTGGYAVYPHILENEDGSLNFRCDLFDPIQVYPEVGYEGIETLYRVYTTSLVAARTMAEANGWDAKELQDRHVYRKDDFPVVIVNCWEMDGKDVINTVIMNDALVREPTHEEQHRRIPIQTGPANGVPFRDYDSIGEFPGSSWQSQWGEAVISSNKEVYKQIDRLASWMLQITKRHALPGYLDINEEGIPTVDVNRLNELGVVPRKPGEDFKPILPPTSPREREELLSYFIGATQRGGLSHVAFGSLGIEISGVTLQQLLTATRSRLLPYIKTTETVLSEIGMEFLDQFQFFDKKVSLDVRAVQQGPGMGYLIEDFDPKDIPKSTYLDVVMPLALPDDSMERVQLARQAMGNSGPLADWQTIADEFLQFQDPELIRQRMDEDLAREHPAMVAFRMIFGMKERAATRRAQADGDKDEEMAATILEEIADGMLEKVASLVAGNGGGENAEGTPRRQREPTSDVQPAEAGPNSPDLFNRIFGNAAQNGGPRRQRERPSTDDDRLRNMGLVGPRG
jgi:hypothetical protein